MKWRAQPWVGWVWPPPPPRCRRRSPPLGNAREVATNAVQQGFIAGLSANLSFAGAARALWLVRERA